MTRVTRFLLISSSVFWPGGQDGPGVNKSLMAPRASSDAFNVCAAKLFESGSVSSECFTLGLSKLLGTFVILGGVAFKVPQILKIAKNKSADGIALSQFLFELCISAITLSFNYHISAPFSTYGESFFILLQNVVIVFQVSYYKKVLSTMFVIISRVPQIMTNFRTRNVENLSIVTWGLNLVGASIRVFTTIREIPDQKVLIFAFFITALLSGTVVLQILAFGKKHEKKPAEKTKAQ